MDKLNKFIKENPKFILSSLSIILGVVLMLKFNLDKKAVAIIALVIGFVTNFFTGLMALIALVPFIGPLILKVFTIPFFWLLNAIGYFTAGITIKKGYRKDVLMHRAITVALLTGIVIGYILGHIEPLKLR